MLQPLLSIIKLLIAMIVAGLSYFYRLPMIVFVALGWWLWLWFVMSERKVRRLAALGFGLAALGWTVSLFERGFMLKVEGSHFPASSDHWMNLAHISFRGGIGLMMAGLILLAYVDYNRLPKPRPKPELADGVKADQDRVWPPAPKQPQ
jgi:hypothetical protein